MNEEIYNGNIGEMGVIPEYIINHIPTVEAHVKVLAIDELKILIDDAHIKQDKLLDRSNYSIIMSMLDGLICLVWKDLAVDVSNKMLVLNCEISIRLYQYLYKDFKLLSMNYGVNKTDNDIVSTTKEKVLLKKKLLLNTTEQLREEVKYLDGSDELKDEFYETLSAFELKVDYHGNTKQLTALFIAMEKSGIHLLLNVGETDEKLVYPEILDIFKDYFYWKYAFSFDKPGTDRLKRNFKNNRNTYMTDDKAEQLIQSSRVNLNQAPSLIRYAYEEKYMHDFDDFRVLLRQLFKENVNDHREFANHRFEEPPFIPLTFFKYTMLGR